MRYGGVSGTSKKCGSGNQEDILVVWGVKKRKQQKKTLAQNRKEQFV